MLQLLLFIICRVYLIFALPEFDMLDSLLGWWLPLVDVGLVFNGIGFMVADVLEVCSIFLAVALSSHMYVWLLHLLLQTYIYRSCLGCCSFHSLSTLLFQPLVLFLSTFPDVVLGEVLVLVPLSFCTSFSFFL